MIEFILCGFVLAGLILPGLGWALGARWPAPFLAAGVISALAILVGVVGFSLARIPITIGPVAAWLGVVAFGGGGFWWRRRVSAPATTADWGEWWLMLPALPMIAVAVGRALGQPLPGADVDFRWNYLAELMVQFGHLDYYPPMVAADFSRYFWADGIAPLVSSLYAWTYLATGSLDRHWTAVPVLLQVAGLFVLLRELGACWGGPRAGWLACALGGTTFLLLFAFNLGQESGLTAIGTGGMVYYLSRWQRTRQGSLLVAAAACAALAACAREYGIAFALTGTFWALSAGAGLKRASGFALMALLLPAVWHLRNWVLTGNPVYSQNLAGIFPVNPVFAAWMSSYAEAYSVPLRQVKGWLETARLFGISSLPALLGLFGGAWLFRGKPGWLGASLTAATVAACWLASVPYTAGGMFYSMRVLSPLLVVGCAWGGAVLAHWVPGRRYLGVLLAGLTLYGLDASLRAWTVPVNPYRIAPRDWPTAGYSMQREFAENDRPFLVAAAAQGHGKVLSESAGAQRVFRAAGRDLVPIWSPEVEFLFGPAGTANAAHRLQAMGYSHVLLTRVQSSVDFLARTGALERLNGHLRSVMANDTFVLFALVPGPVPEVKSGQ